jgi:coenzyme F420-dependent glucose-6-phosphate dehydrogenase
MDERRLPRGKVDALDDDLQLGEIRELHADPMPRLPLRQTGDLGSMELGWSLSSEDHGPAELVRQAQLAEDAGFTFAGISDHFHPWTSAQGESPFVWTTLGAIGQATSTLRVMTGVTCPLIRIHPAIVAQAAATTAALMPGRFTLGVGTGENLNEHITGARWPLAWERLEMLEEAIELIRELWKGEAVTHKGEHYLVQEAQIYTLPDKPPEIYVAAGKPNAAQLAGRSGDGLVSTAPDEEVVKEFVGAGGEGKPVIGQFHCAYDENKDAALERALELWPNAALAGSGGQELPSPRDFEEAADNVTVKDIAEVVPAGPDPEPYLEQIRKFEEAGFTHVYLHQIGENQEEFAKFVARELMPAL